MSTRIRVSAGVLAAALAVIAYSAADIAGQQPAAAPTAKPQPAAASTLKPVTTTYKVKTPDGQPDLQGFWSNATLTPLERPNGITAEFVTREEFEKRVAQQRARDEEQTKPGETADVHYDFTQFALDRTQTTIAKNYRTSQVIDPPDGRIPVIAAAGGGGRGAAGGGGRGAAGAGGGRGAAGGGGAAAAGGGGGGGRAGQYDRVQNLPNATRCIIMGGAGPPLRDAGYNANYHIVQGAGTVMILTEMIHDARIIPLDNRPAPPGGYSGWMGSSRGRWEGDTLVVETTNFNGRNPFQRSTPNLKVTERFVRTSADQITYRYTVEDPAGPIYEVACHEGNYGLANTLAGVRLEEKRAAEEAAKKGTK
jgi:hypothetical protein